MTKSTATTAIETPSNVGGRIAPKAVTPAQVGGRISATAVTPAQVGGRIR